MEENHGLHSEISGHKKPDLTQSQADHQVGRVGSNLTALGIGTLFSRVLNFATLVVLAERLLPAGYGLIVYAQTAASYFQLLAEFGLGVFGTRELARERHRVIQWVGTILGVRVLTTLIVVGLLALYIFLIPQHAIQRALLLLFALSLPISVFAMEWVFQALERMQYVGLARIAQAVVALVLVVLFVKDQADILIFPLIVAASLLVPNLFLGIIIIRQWGIPKFFVDNHHLWPALRTSVPFGLSALMMQIYNSADRLILTFFRTETEVGWYDTAYRFVLLFTNTAGLVAQVLLPGLSAMSRQDEPEKARNTIQLIAKVMIFIGAPTAVGGMFLADSIIDLFYGPGYAPSAYVLSVIIWQVFTVYTSLAFALALLAFDQQKFYFYSVVSGAVVNLISNFLLIPRFGMMGASVATILAEVVVLVSFYHFANRHVLRVSIINPMLKTGLACVGMVLVMQIRAGFWPRLLFGVLTYIIILLLSSPFTRYERARLLRGTLQ